MTDNFKARLKELRALSRTDPLRVDILEEEQAMTDEVEPVDHERAGWEWLENMVGGISDDDPNDIAYSADQMVDAFMAGASLRTQTSPDKLVEALKFAAEIIKDSWGDEQMERGDCQAYNVLTSALAEAENRHGE